MIISPITSSNNVVIVNSIDVKLIISAYSNNFGVDVSKYFNGISQIDKYLCMDSSYQFYYPFIEGNTEFYEHFQQYEWYYMDWKWEHQKVEPLIKAGDKILEVGCAKGSFLEKMRLKGAICTGLELNNAAINIARSKRLNVLSQTLQEHSEYNAEKYDLICSFQVLEHIGNVGSFIKDMLSILKKNGKLVISVPNNNSFIGWDEYAPLNMPPHHLGLWNELSLKKICNYFNLRLDNIYFEPLQKYHYDYYASLMSHKLIRDYGVVGKLINKVIWKPLKISLRAKPDLFKGHTCVAIYTKL